MSEAKSEGGPEGAHPAALERQVTAHTGERRRRRLSVGRQQAETPSLSEKDSELLQEAPVSPLNSWFVLRRGGAGRQGAAQDGTPANCLAVEAQHGNEEV